MKKEKEIRVWCSVCKKRLPLQGLMKPHNNKKGERCAGSDLPSICNKALRV